MSRWKKAMALGFIHYLLQMSFYVLGFALGPGLTARKTLGISLYDVAAVITFPFVFLAEKFRWSGLGLSTFLLNSIVWATLFYLILVAAGKFTRKGESHDS